ncbi:MAG: hypothetical protein ACJA1H_001430 [Glaciecola sp.]|jgi:hypothetical protein
MKYFKILALLLCSSVLFFYGCNDSSKTPKQDSVKQVEVSDTPNPPVTATPSPTTKEPAQNASGVWHYTCRIGCVGGAGSVVNCGTCGMALAHNTVYHGKTSDATSSAPFATPPPATKATPAKEPAQNASGVWHYTCAIGCLGGAGTAGSCNTCNGALSHNKGYH